MQIKTYKSKTPEVEAFNKKEWEKADKEHYKTATNWKKDKYRLVAYSSDKEILGTLGLEILGGVAYVSTLIVSSLHRQEGVGTHLMNKAENTAKKHNCHKIYLETGKGWDSEKFYKKLGYEITGSLDNHYFNTDYIILSKKLDDIKI